MKKFIKRVICRFVYDNYGETEENACYNLDALAEEITKAFQDLDEAFDYFFFDEEHKQLKIIYLNNDASSACFEELVIGDDVLKTIDYSCEDFIDEIYEKARCYGIYKNEHPELFADIMRSINNSEYSMVMPGDETGTLGGIMNNAKAMRNIVKERIMHFAGVKNND